MNLFTRLLTWLSFKPDTTVKFGNPALYPIDTEKLERELDLLGEAKKLGLRGLPASDTLKPTGVEYKIIQMIQKAKQDYADWAAGHLKVLNQDINSLDLTQIINRAKGTAEEFERKASSLLASCNPVLRDLQSLVLSLISEFEEFKKFNGLTRTPHYPSGNEVFLRWAILVLLVFIEGLANSIFFARGLGSGLIDGFLNAVLFAFLNVGWAVLIGRKIIPYLIHKNQFRKMISIIFLLIGIACSFAIALGTAHYRDQLGINPQMASKLALDSFVSSPFSLMEFHSWVLFGLSLVFGFIAMYDAFGLDDSYIGYGKLHRRLETATSDYAEEMEVVRESLEELKSESLAELEKFSDNAQVILKRLDDTIQQKINTKTKMDLSFSNAEHCLDTLLYKFRTENRIHRESQDVPNYFNESVVLIDIAVPDFGVDEDIKKYAAQELLVQGFKKQIEPIRKKIQTSFNKHFSGLKSIDEHFIP